MKSHVRLIFSLAFLIVGCAPQKPTNSNAKIDIPVIGTQSNGTASLTNAKCLHVDYNNHNYLVYSENDANAWITDGRCDVAGAPQNAEIISLNYRYKNEGLRSEVCRNTSVCKFSERNYGDGKEIMCSSANATISGLSYRASTDHYACP